MRNTPTHAHSDSDIHTYIYSYRNVHAYAYSNGNIYTNTYNYGDVHADAYANGVTKSYSHAKVSADSSSATESVALIGITKARRSLSTCRLIAG